jgi:hypothetical protein
MLAGLTAWKQIIAALFAGRSYPFFKRLCSDLGQGASHWARSPCPFDLNEGADGTITSLHVPYNQFEQVLSVQHRINGRREQCQIPQPSDTTIGKKTSNPLHLIRCEAISFASLKTFVPDSVLGCDFLPWRH